MHKHAWRYWSRTVCLLTVATPAYADGGISSLGAYLGLLMMVIGTGGLVVVALMVPAVQAGIRKNRADKWVVAALSLGALYVLCSLILYFGTLHEEWAKFPGFVAVVAFALLCIFFLRHQKRLRVAVLAGIGMVTLAMLVTPAQFWKGNAFDLVETIFFDNSQDLEGVLRGKNRDSIDSRKTLLHFADGRKILQFERSANVGEIGGIFSSGPSKLVRLEQIDAVRAGQWFEITHYVVDRRYQHARQNIWQAPRYSLFERTVNMYRPNGDRSIGVLLDASAGIDFKAILLRILASSGIRSLKSELVKAGGIDVSEQVFVDEAFENRYAEAYRFLLTQGIDVNAMSSDGESMLHRVAEIGEANLMKFMVSRGANLQVVNEQGLTPLQYFRERHGHRPSVMRPFELAFPEATFR